jgi:mannose-6-phosphate isomerase
MSGIVRIPPEFVGKPWGSRNLEPFFPAADQLIGEVWFQAPGDFPLLVKFLFTEGPLSVQVHPDDDYARVHHNSRGKTEMWYVLRATPGAKVGIGFEHPVTKEQLRAASLSGKIESLLHWIDVAPGDVIFTPAGTVHAIGAGLALCEIQQRSDVTYRLYDYGSSRELHLDRGVAVSDCGCHPGKLEPQGDRLVDCEKFITERIELSGARHDSARHDLLLIAISGSGSINGEPFRAGDVFLAAAGSAIRLEGYAVLLRTWSPA